MHEHEMNAMYNEPFEALVREAEKGEVIELLRNGTTVAVIVGIDAYDELVAEAERASQARAFLATVVPAQ